MSIVSKTTLKTYFETGDFPTQIQFENLIDSLYPYEKYIALLSQSGTNAPTATVLENTLSGTIVWTRNSVGHYHGTLTGAFLSGKVVAFTNIGDNSVLVNFTKIFRFTDNIIRIDTTDTTFNSADDLLNNTSIEIRVYP